jgi:hypothetical protein
VREIRDAPRTTDRFQYVAEQWVEWVRPGVPGPSGQGWVYPVSRENPLAPVTWPRADARPSIDLQAGDKITWLPTNSDRTVSGTVVITGNGLYAKATASGHVYRVYPHQVTRHRPGQVAAMAPAPDDEAAR